MKTLALGVLLCALVLIPGNAAHGQPLSPGFIEAARVSTFVFEGQVTARNATTMSLAPGGARRTVVQVGQVLRSPPGFQLDGQKPITVVVRDTTGLVVRSRAVFFAVGLLFGSSAVLGERWRDTVTRIEDVTAAHARLLAADSINLERAILQRARGSEAVILGAIEGITQVRLSETALIGRGEHTPIWLRAAVRRSVTYLGVPRTVKDRVIVYFPSPDGPPEDAPTLRTRDQAILFLRPTSFLSAGLRAGLDTAQSYFVIDPADARPSSDSARVLRVLRSQINNP